MIQMAQREKWRFLATLHRMSTPSELFSRLTRPVHRFDPNFPLMHPGMRFFPMHPGATPGLPTEDFDLDEHGNVNWRSAWLKELANLQALTEEQEKAGAAEDGDWYKVMYIKIKGSMFSGPPMGMTMNPEAMIPTQTNDGQQH
jgi:forkhead box protein J2/3